MYNKLNINKFINFINRVINGVFSVRFIEYFFVPHQK